jgi:solute carrier family 44 protein 1 (choline transporter-like protein)/choline transporter-like protein 2/4/5
LCTSLVAAIPVYIYVANAELTPYGNLTKDIETPIIPTTFVFLIGLFFTAIFQGGYDITCKTIIQLYLMDNEMFFGEQRFVEDFIREFMEFVGKEEEEEYKIGFTRQVKIDEEKLK